MCLAPPVNGTFNQPFYERPNLHYATRAKDRLQKVSAPSHLLDATVLEDAIYERGRPSKTKPEKAKEIQFKLKAEISEKSEAIEQRKLDSGCFVLLTNVPRAGEDAHTAKEILVASKAQHGVERNFSFLKVPLIVNDLSLKKPDRIED